MTELQKALQKLEEVFNDSIYHGANLDYHEAQALYCHIVSLTGKIERLEVQNNQLIEDLNQYQLKELHG